MMAADYLGAVVATAESLAMLDISIDVDEGGHTVIQTARIPWGRFLGSHKHELAHQSVLVSGRARLHLDDGTLREMEGFELVTIPAGVRHTVEAITDVVWLCVWSLGDEDRAAIEATVRKG